MGVTSGAEQQGTSDGVPAQVVVVSHEGTGTGTGAAGQGSGTSGASGAREARDPTELVEHPGKVMRMAAMIRQLLEEVRSAPLDEAGRTRLAEIHRRSLIELEDGLAPELIEELERISLPFGDQTPSDAELRIAQAQLVGWLEGLFHGIQAALVAQQMAAQQQLQTIRGALPPGSSGQAGNPGQPPGNAAGMPNRSDSREGGPTGQYL